MPKGIAADKREDMECIRCGECCKQYCESIWATKEDLLRWHNDLRFDILENFSVLFNGGWTTADNLEVEGLISLPEWGFDMENPKTRDYYYTQCPFLRKRPRKAEYYCRIYDTRPTMCSDFRPWEWIKENPDYHCCCPLTKVV